MGIFNKFRKKNRNRALVVGLDGVPFSMLQDLIKRGIIPNMASIFGDGYFGKMEVCLPEISSISWSSFMTGAQSGDHNIYGFIDLEPGTYKMFFPNYQHIKAPTIWDELSAKGKKTVVINMPATYPARDINGGMVSGFVAVDINKAVYPTNFIPKLNEMGYRIDIDLVKARNDHDLLFRELDATLAARARAVDHFWQEIDWDLFVVVITGTDRLMHFLWDAYEDPSHKYHQAFLEYFWKVDEFVGKLHDKFEGMDRSNNDENHFLMVSDHGFTKIETEVYLNRWLQENGYLKFQKEQPETIMDIGPGSTAFVIDPSRVYINLKDKYPLGTIKKSDYEQVRQELKEGFEALTFSNGKKIMKNVFFKEELYQGPYFDKAPDLILLSNHGYDLKGIVSKKQVFGRTSLKGMHTQEDAFFYSSNDVKCNTIFDAKDVILSGILG